MPVLKMVEVGVLLVAVIAFAWWQLRDVKRAQARSRPQVDEDAALDRSVPLEPTAPCDSGSEPAPAPGSKRP
jgi:hypothetical protein